MRALTWPPDFLANQGRLASRLALLFVVAGCAAAGTNGARGPSGTSGVVTWEVSDVGRIISADNRRILWSYLITLRNTSDRPIQIERVERALLGSSAETIGGTPVSQAYRRTLAARSELRYSTSDNWGWSATGSLSTRPVEMLPAVNVYRRFIGKDDAGQPVEVSVRIRLDSSIGRLAKPPTPPQNLPPPKTVAVDDLPTLVGLWRGSYRVVNTVFNIPIAATILADGTVQLEEHDPVTNRYSRTVQVKDGELYYSGGRDQGTLTLHELGQARMLVGHLTDRGDGSGSGTQYAIYLEPAEPTTRTATAPAAPVEVSSPTPPAPPSPPIDESTPVELTGIYHGTLVGTRSGRSYSDQVTVAVVQIGREFSGSWSTPSSSGTVSGTVLGRSNFSFRLRQETPCAAEYGGLGTIGEQGTKLTASYRGGGCQGSQVAASLIVTRDSK